MVFLKPLLYLRLFYLTLKASVRALSLPRGFHELELFAVARDWAFRILDLGPWPVECVGAELLPKGPCVLVANHTSILDSWIIFKIPTSFGILVKKEIASVPLMGKAMSHWAIFVERRSKQERMKSWEEARSWLAGGRNLFFFPEGTRTDGEFLPFRWGAFRLAVEQQVPVVPVVIHGAAKAWPRKAWFPRPCLLRLRILSPETGDDVELLTHRVREKMIKVYKELDASG